MNISNRQKDEEYQSIFDNALEGIFQTSADGRFIKVNPALARIFGYDSPEDMMQTVTDTSAQLHVDGGVREKFVDELTKQGKVEGYEERNYCKDGSIIWTHTNARAVRDDKGNTLYFEGFLTDITANKEAELALRESEERYRALVDHLPGVVFLDAPNDSETTIYVSPKIEDVLGYSPKEWTEEIYWSDAIHPEDREHILAENKRTDETGENFIQEYRVRKKDGEYIWIREEASLMKDERGEPLFWQGFFLDISDWKQAENTILQSEEKFRQLFEAESDAIFLIDNKSGNILEANAAASALYGYSKEELLCKKNSDLSAEPEDTQKVTKETPIKRESVVSVPLRHHKKKDGTVFPVEITGRFFEWRGLSVHIAAIRDITVRKNAEEALRASEERFRLAFQTSPDSININRMEDGLFVDINEGFTTITGYTQSDVKGKTSTEINIWDNPNDRAKLVEMLKESGYAENLEAKFRTKDGSVVTGLMSARIIMLDDTPHIISITREIESIKQAEKTLQRQLRELSILHKIALAASSSKSVDELIEKITQIIGETLYPDNFGVLLMDEDGTALYPHASYRGISNGKFPTSVPLEHGVSGQVAATGKPLRIANTRKHKSYIEVTSQVRSELCVPITHGDRILGVINTESLKINAFTGNDEQLLTTIASTLSTAIEKLRLLDAEKKRRQDAEMLREATIALTTSLNLKILFETILENLANIVPYDSASIAMKENGKLVIVAGRGFPNNYDVVGKQLKSDGLWTALGKKRGSVIISDVQSDPEFEQWKGSDYIRGWMGVSMVTHDNIIGYIFVDSHLQGAYSEREATLVETFANSAAVAVENARLFEAEQQSREREETLREATAALTTSIEIDELYKIILDSLSKLIPYDSASIELVNQESLEIVAESNLPKDYQFIGQKYVYEPKKWEFPVSEHWPLIIPDVQADERFEKMEGTEYIRGWMGVPMFAQDRLIGFLNLDNREVNFYTQEHAALAQTFGNQAATAIENARLFEAEQRRHRESEILRQTTEAITSSLDIQQVLNAILNNLNQVVPFDSAALFLLEGENVRITAGIGFENNENVIDSIFPADNALLLEVWETGKPLILDDAQVDQRFEKWAAADQIRGWMGVPLVIRGEMIGCITIDNFEPKAYNQHDASLAITFAHQAAAAIENARLFERGEKQIHQLTVLRDIDSAISSSFDLRVVLDLLLEHAVRVLDVDAATILLYDPDLHSLTPHTIIGFMNKRSAYWSEQIRIGEGSAGYVVLQRKMVHIADLRNASDFTQSDYSSAENFKSYFGVPLIGKGLIKGVLEVFTKEESHPKQGWFDFLQTLAGQAAIAIDNVQLFKNLQRSSQELILAYDATLAGWGQALELRDKETRGHSDRVVERTLELAQRMGVEGDEITHIMRGTLLHDIGKMAIPDHILNKPGPLMEDEWDIMRQHPKYAYDLMNRIPYLRPALDIPYAHHERWDGSGYPRGLKGEEIPLAARIFAVVDIWDALSNKRPYREAWPEDKVIEYIKNTAGIELDPNVVENFLELIEEENQAKKQAE